MIRLFAALPIPPEIAEQLRPLQKGLAGASWRPERNFHITLRFFGEVSYQMAKDIDQEIADIPAASLQLTLRGCGYFGKREPRSVWAKVEHSKALNSLAGACERIARRHGLPAEKRGYRPHVTLAYCHGTSPEEAIDYERQHIEFSAGPWIADRFHLYSSHFGDGPSRYIAEAEYPLSLT